MGLNVLRNDARSGVGITAATGAAFLRVNVHTGSLFTVQGLLEGRASVAAVRQAYFRRRPSSTTRRWTSAFSTQGFRLK